MIFLKVRLPQHFTGYLSDKEEKVKFSIVIPFYNVEKYAVQCLQSLMQQTFSDFEAILVDDGSTDGTAAIIDRYAAMDARFKPFHKENGGLTSARKCGTEMARGEYIVPVDGDDWISENYLMSFSHLIDEYHADIYMAGYRRVSDNGTILQERVPEKGKTFYKRNEIENEIFPNLMNLIPMVWSKAFKRELYTKYQMMVDNCIAMGEDGVISYSCIANADSLCMSDECNYFYRDNQNSMTRLKTKYIPLEGALRRIRILEKTLPTDNQLIQRQLSAYVAHALFNVTRSHFKSNTFSDVKKEIQPIVRQRDIKSYLKTACKTDNKKEKLAAKALYRQQFLSIKIFSMID